MIYLASPYTHKDPQVVQARYNSAMKCTAALIQQGFFVWSPIAHCHVMAHKFGLPTDYEFWRKFSTDFIRRCDRVFVLKIDGWHVSAGVREEVALARMAEIPVEFVNEEGEITEGFRPFDKEGKS